MESKKRTNDIFRQLAFGASFRKKKPRNDGEQLGNVKGQDTGNKNLDVQTVSCIESVPQKSVKANPPADDPLLLMSNLLSNQIQAGSGRKKKNKKSTEVLIAERKQEMINRIRNEHELHVRGENVPEPCVTLQELQEQYGVHQNIIDNITQQNMHTPTPIQMQCIPAMIMNRNLLASAPTGSGKTLAFLVPLLAKKFKRKAPKNIIKYLVLAPTRELAKQIFHEAEKLVKGQKITVSLIPSDIKKFISANIVICTPNRLIYLLQSDMLVSLDNVEYMVVDESDRLFEAGPSGFRDQLAHIYRACNGVNVRRAFFSATFSFEVEQWCLENLEQLVSVTVGVRNRAISSVEQKLMYTGNEEGKLVTLRQLMVAGSLPPPVLIFVQSIDRVKQLKEELMEPNWKVDAIFGQMKHEERENAVAKFHAGESWVLICTELLGRGIDFKGVKMVVNFDFPTSSVSYIHRIGRTGRAGNTGQAITFFTDSDKPMLRNIANVIKDAGCQIPEFMMQLSNVKRRTRKLLKHRAPHRKDLRKIGRHRTTKTTYKKIRKDKKKHGEKEKGMNRASRGEV